MSTPSTPRWVELTESATIEAGVRVRHEFLSGGVGAVEMTLDARMIIAPDPGKRVYVESGAILSPKTYTLNKHLSTKAEFDKAPSGTIVSGMNSQWEKTDTNLWREYGKDGHASSSTLANSGLCRIIWAV